MPAAQPLCTLFGVKLDLSWEENALLEAELFSCVCEELQEIFRQQYKDYFQIMRYSLKKENAMLDERFVRLVIQDILNTDEYNVGGIAYYTNSHTEVIEEIIAGKNTNPSAFFVRRVIDLHRVVRKEIYQNIAKKITEKLLPLESQTQSTFDNLHPSR